METFIFNLQIIGVVIWSFALIGFTFTISRILFSLASGIGKKVARTLKWKLIRLNR